MKITVLNENMVYRKNIIAEHGLSVLIEHDNKKILMDQTTPNMIQRISEMFERKPLISKEI